MLGILECALARAGQLGLRTKISIDGRVTKVFLDNGANAPEASLSFGDGYLSLRLGEYSYTEVDEDQFDIEYDCELLEILLSATKLWLSGSWQRVALRGLFRRKVEGIRIDFADGDYIELAPAGVNFVTVKHKWTWN